MSVAYPVATRVLLGLALALPAVPALAQSAQDRTQSAIAAGLLVPGDFQIVSDKRERASAIAGFATRARSLGISARFERCDLLGLLAGPSADSMRAHGGICTARIGTGPRRTYLVCDNNMGGFALVQPDAVPLSEAFVEKMMRRICY